MGGGKGATIALTTVNQGESIESALRRFKRRVIHRDHPGREEARPFYAADPESEAEVEAGAEAEKENAPSIG